MANYAAAVNLAQKTLSTSDVALVRHFASRPGIALNLE